MSVNSSCQPWEDYDLGRLAKGRLFFYIGAGLSQGAGIVGWHELVRCVSRYRRQGNEESESDGASDFDEAGKNQRYLREFIEEVGADGHRILSRESGDVRSFGRTVLLNLVLRKRSPRIYPALQDLEAEDLQLHHAVWRSHAQGVFTTNYDMLLEESFHLTRLAQRVDVYGRCVLRTYRYDAKFLRFLLSVPRFVLKMHGDINDLGTMLFDPASSWNGGGALHGARGGDLRSVFDAARQLGHMVYVGCGARDETFRRLHQRVEPGGFQRVALMPRSEVEGLGADFAQRTGIRLLTYDDAKRASAREQVGSFLDALATLPCRRPEMPASEALDVWNHLNGATGPRRSVTKPWGLSVTSVSQWRSGKPDEEGQYLWRRRHGDRTPFYARVEPYKSYDNYFCARLDHGGMTWDSCSGDATDSWLGDYEWIGPLDESDAVAE